MVPIILLAPWASSRSLEKALERVEKAFPRRRFFLDIDRDYAPTNLDSPAQMQWLELRNPSNQFAAWRDFLVDYPLVMPCLQLEEQTKEDISRQIENTQRQEREFCLRIELQRMPQNLNAAIEALVDIGTADFTVVIEGGWVRDPLMMYTQADGLISGVLANLDGRVPIAVSCTSAPKTFQDITGVEETPFSNHDLLDQIRRNTNREIVIYGDWGSTRPREDGFGRTPLPRIDYPTDDAWYIARNRDEGWDYQRAAQSIVNSPAWDGSLGIWGEEMIQVTTVNPEFAIDTPPKNVAARVNIHLHRQALYGSDISGIDLDEDWVD
tara:strand:- start:1651 stop:2622 length:972 start_codon:yes stop_codon:yes gene_type:complete